MELNAIVDTLDDIDEPIRPLYTETEDGKFRLNVKGVEFEDDVKPLRNALKTVRREKENLEKRVSKIPEDFDPATWEELKALAEAQSQNGEEGGENGNGKEPAATPDVSEIIKNTRKKIEGQYAEQIKELEDALDAERQRNRKTTIERALVEAVDSVGITDPYLKRGAIALLKERGIDVQEDDDGNPIAVIKDDLGAITPINDFISEWAKTEEGASYLPASGATGGGSTGRPGGSGSRKKMASEMTEAEKREYIRDNGSEAWTALLMEERKSR